jgi:Cdc6-like AAA superfamily ATPase
MNYIELANLICKSKNHCLIHGPAGTGKSTLVKNLMGKIGKRCLNLAPTGLSAYNIDGTTIDSLLSCFYALPNSALFKFGMRYSYVIIDKISMVQHFKMEKIFQIIDFLNKRGKKSN